MKTPHKHHALALSVTLLGLALSGCSAQPTHPSLKDTALWSYATDPSGSTATIGDHLIENGVASIEFQRVARPTPDQNSWIELIYKLPDGNLKGVTSIKLTYRSSAPVLIKLSQSDYGENGDSSYAHYQARLPAASEWTTQNVTVSDFSRPYWTPAESADVGIVPGHISAIYLVPDLPDETGGYAKLEVKALELLK